MNPRDAVVTGEVRLHRMIRRGTSYGPVLPDGVLDDDGADRGLCFVFRGRPPGAAFALIGSTPGKDWAQHVVEYDPADWNSGLGIERFAQAAQVPAVGYSRALPDLTLGQVKEAQRGKEAVEQVLDMREWVLGNWVQGAAFTTLGMCVTAGVLTGEVVGTRGRVRSAPADQADDDVPPP